jgi:membrane associated rhomboid family serine protease
MTRPRFLAFYLLGGVIAAVAQVAATPTSGPMVGASGAIGAVMGAYLILYPKVRVYALVPLGIFITSVSLPAWSMLLYWAGLQLLSASVGDATGIGVAVWAHVGGFTAGMILVKTFVDPHRIAARLDAERWRPARVL